MKVDINMKTILIDVDGTVATKGDRNYYQWHLLDRDLPKPHIIDMVMNYPCDYKFILTARNEGYPSTPKNLKKFPDITNVEKIGRELTEAWVLKYMGVVDDIFMKPANCYDNSAVWKSLKVKELEEKGFDISLIVDDNPEVCDTLTGLGYNVVRVMGAE